MCAHFPSFLSMKSVLVIGAGVAGLLAAQDLQRHGFDVTVLDKGRGLGGRMATRRISVGEHTGKADHGAQYITAYSPRFEALVSELTGKGIVQPWSENQQGVHRAKRSRYIAPEGMTAVAKYLAEGINTRLNERVTTLGVGGQLWKVHTDTETYTADALVITAPVPQSLMLLETLTESVVSDEEYQALSAVQYSSCITLILALQDEYSFPIGGNMMKFEGGRTIMWIADNREKGISPDIPTLTIHTGAEFAKEHWETKEEELVPLIFAELRNYLSPSMIQAYSLHRWRYSRVVKPYPTLFFHAKHSPLPLVLAGDAFAGETPLVTRIEDAALSGWAAAEYLVDLRGR